MKKTCHLEIALFKHQAQMEIDHRFQSRERIGNFRERPDDISFGQIQTIIEHGIQQTFFARNVVIKTRLGQPRRRGHITHRSIVVAFAVKHLRRNLENPVPGEITVPALPFLPLFTHPKSTYRPIGRLTLYAD